MKLSRKLIALAVIACLLLPALTSCGIIELVPDFLLPDDDASYHEIQSTVSVSIAEGEHYTVTSANPVKVKRGADATFTLEIEDGYEFNPDTEGASFTDGVLTVSKVKYPTTVDVLTKKKPIKIEIQDDPTPEPEPEPLPEPLPDTGFETVQLSASPHQNVRFICWTLDTPLKEGGIIFAREARGTFQIPTGKTPVANYVDSTKNAVIYRTNGGLTADGKDFYYQTTTIANYYMPNTIIQDGTFVRSGYVLSMYTENADGTGDYTTLGGKISPGNNGFVELYCQWERFTSAADFSFSVIDSSTSFKPCYNTATTVKYAENAVSITSYNADATKVVIPPEITVGSGDEAVTYKVQHIAKDAFSGKSMQKLVLPSSIVKVENGAFSSCKNLTTLVLHDNYTEILDGAFNGCTSLQKVYLNAGRRPWHSGEAQFSRKYEKIVKAYNEGKKKIVVMSGSSSLYGLVAEEAEKEFGGQYSFVNFGTNAGVSIALYMEATTRYYTSGDIIVQAPETTSGTQLGDTNLTYLAFRGCEIMLNIFSNVDMRNYTGFFSGLSEFNQAKRNTSAGTDYDKEPTFINVHTDMMTNNEGGTWDKSGSPTNLYNVSRLTDARMQMLKKIHGAIKEKGAKVYISFAPVNIAIANSYSRTPEAQADFAAALENKLGVPVISSPADYLFETSYFNNSDYHLGIPGALIRTERLSRDIKAQMERDGIPVPDSVPSLEPEDPLASLPPLVPIYSTKKK